METITKEVNVYNFKELSDSSKENARLAYSYELCDHWAEYTIDDMKGAAEILGIDIDNIYFSGFCSQGDGACFMGNYKYIAGSLSRIVSSYPNWVELHDIAANLQAIQKRALYGLTCIVAHKGRYYHEYCTDFEVFYKGDYLTDKTCHFEDDIKQALRDFMRLCYKSLEQSYQYEVSLDNVQELSDCNDWKFLENGEIYVE